MRRHPFRGDYGPALANIRPRYRLKLTTLRGKEGLCRIKSTDLAIRFTMTLPSAQQRHRFSRQTKSQWTNFYRFARSHELRHKRIYLGCARNFERQIKKLRNRNCAALTRQARQKLRRQERQCDRQHRAFDGKDFPRVPHLPLFRAARGRSVWR
jgi:predicted secreted Zn-dependent protease